MAILGKAQSCEYKVQKKENPSKKCTMFQEKDCCSSMSYLKKGDDIIKKTNNELQAEDTLFLNTFFYTNIDLFEGLDKNVVPFKHYKPPLLFKDMQIINKTFLI